MSISGYGGVGTASPYFNGDTGANYYSTYVTLGPGAAIAAAAHVENASDVLIRTGIGISKGRSVQMLITNVLGKTKVVGMTIAQGTGLAATLPTLILGAQGEWTGLPQITQLDVKTPEGVNILAGSSLTVIGWSHNQSPQF